MVEADDYLLVPAFPTFGKGSSIFFAEGPSRRSFISVTLSIEESDSAEAAKFHRSYGWVADHLAALLSGFYGKLVTNHGYTNIGDLFSVPDLDLGHVGDHALPPFNSKPRAATGLNDLNIVHSSEVLASLLSGGLEKDEWASVLSAAAFYQQALALFSDRPHLSFSLLVSSLECLLPLIDYSEGELFDEELLSDFASISAQSGDGPSIVGRLKKRMYQVRRKCSAFVARTLDSQFYERPETKEAYALVKPDHIEERIRAVYDLRSRFLHTGRTHGNWVNALKHIGAEIMVGEPQIQDTKLKKLVATSVSLTGLERIVQYCLFSWISRLAKPSEAPPTK